MASLINKIYSMEVVFGLFSTANRLPKLSAYHDNKSSLLYDALIKLSFLILF